MEDYSTVCFVCRMPSNVWLLGEINYAEVPVTDDICGWSSSGYVHYAQCRASKLDLGRYPDQIEVFVSGLPKKASLLHETGVRP